MAPRKPMAERANMPPEASPISVGRMPPAPDPSPSSLRGSEGRLGFVDITTTPAVAMVIAAIIGNVSVSPRKMRPNTAT